MKNLNRALRMALNYRWSLIGASLCSLLVALFWGANLGAVYPFVEVVLKDKSLTEWVEQRIEDSHQAIEKSEEEIKELESQITTGELDTKQTEVNRRAVRSLKTDIKTQEERISWSVALEPWIKRYAPSDPYMTLVILMCLMVIGTIFRGVFLATSIYLVARVGQRTILDLQNRVFSNVLNMEIAEIDVRGTGDLISRIRGETGAIGGSIITLFGKTVREPLKMFACLIGAAVVNWRLLLFSLLVCPLAVYLMVQLARMTKRASKKAMEESARLLDRLYQALTYMRVVKAFNMEEDERARFRVVAHDVYKKGMRIALYGALARSNNELLGVSIISLSILAGGYMVLNQEMYLFNIRMSSAPMEFGELMAFFAFLIGVSDPLRKLGNVYNQIQSGIVAADRVFPLIDQQPAVAAPARPHAVPNGALGIEFDNVKFAYNDDAPVLNGVTFDLPAGSSMAIIGPNGCGKSTLINLLPRFFDVASGCIRVGGRDLRDFSPNDLRAEIGYVTQMTMLFRDSIGANISYGNPDATTEQIENAARRAHAHEFIRDLETGYESDIGEHGGRLSGGQRQRLALARAILHDPRILILDEATSQIDPESEALIHATLKSFIKNRTTLIVTHRMSTLELVDRIMVMNKGKVLDCGTHAELIKRCDVYRRLRQSDLEKVA
ncbi:MAG: ABC transporter ATP-binding protein/permease [Mariniblastus sp.]|nr:ABC transporter ATP-binding protein/permease [Mariniblastus sp.]